MLQEFRRQASRNDTKLAQAPQPAALQTCQNPSLHLFLWGLHPVEVHLWLPLLDLHPRLGRRHLPLRLQDPSLLPVDPRPVTYCLPRLDRRQVLPLADASVHRDRQY